MAKVGFATESHLCLGAVVVQVGVSQSVRQTQLLPPPHKISQQFLHCISNSHFFFQVARSLARGGLKRGERGGKVAGWLAGSSSV